MLGAIIGDIAGSTYELSNYRRKDFAFLSEDCYFTDDTVMTLAVARAVLDCRGDYTCLSAQTARNMRALGRRYPDRGYGANFSAWLQASDPRPYYSFGNGAAMRVSACAYAAKSLEQVKELSYRSTVVTHDHPEGIKGAEAVAVAVYMALNGAAMPEIKGVMQRDYYALDFTLDGIRENYVFDASCQGSVPQALEAFFESESFEDAVRGAVSIGGDSDTIAAVAGSIAGAYYGIPDEIRRRGLRFLDDGLLKILNDFERVFPPSVRARK